MHRTVLVALFFASNVMSVFADDMSTLYSRLYSEYYSSVTGNITYLSTQQTDGSWTDIDYTDTNSSGWQPVKHLQRMLAMSKSYCEQTDKASTTAVNLLAGIEKGFTYWFDGAFESDNWWYNDIGQQQQIGPILALMKNYLKTTTINSACTYLVIPSSNNTGTNLVWESSGLLIRGAIQNNSSYVTKSVSNMRSTITLSSKNIEGIQYDNSYLFHELQIQNGAYGESMIADIVLWMYILRELSFAFPESDVITMRNQVLNGNRWMLRVNQYDFGVSGRTVSRPNGLICTALKDIAGKMKTLDAQNTQQYQDLIDHINGTKGDALIGNKMFYRADYMAQKGANYHLSVKMCSSRTTGTEYMNNENAKGFWLPFGATCLMKDADEYATIFPLWDWTRIPGVTATEETPTFVTYVTQTSTFVGGVSNGECGVATMILNKQNLGAKKSWFMFADETVALGAGITSTNTNNVNTGIAQCLLDGTVTIDGVSASTGTSVAHDDVKWVHHDNVGYVFPQATDIKVSNASLTGSWHDINPTYSTTVTKSVFNLWTSHGLKPTNASYAYIIVPEIKLADVPAYSSNLPIKILSNTSSIQAVTQTTQKITGVVFYTAGSLKIDQNLTISVNNPCALLIDHGKEKVEITASDPSQSKTSVNVTLTYWNYPSEVVSITFPTGNYTGNSVTKSATTTRAVSEIAITKQPLLPLTPNETYQIEKTVSCIGCSSTTVDWSSANTSVATVDQDGLITAKGVGETTITGTIRETRMSAQCDVQVMYKVINESFENNNNMTFLPGGGWSNDAGFLKLSEPSTALYDSPGKNIALHNTIIESSFVLKGDLMVNETSSLWDGACIIWGHQNPTNSYNYADLCKSNDRYGSGIFKISNGSITSLTDITKSLEPAIWHQVILKVKEDNVKLYLDSILICNTTCTSFGSGKIGFGSYGSVCRFDNLDVWQAMNTTAIQNMNNEQIAVSTNNNIVIVQISENLIGSKVSILDVMGRMVCSKTATSATTEISLPDRDRRVVIIMIENKNGKFRKKLLVQ